MINVCVKTGVVHENIHHHNDDSHKRLFEVRLDTDPGLHFPLHAEAAVIYNKINERADQSYP